MIVMKNYEAIQKMNKKEMAAVFFMFLKPFIKKLSKEETADLLQSIEQTLDKEVTPSGITTSEKQPS